MLACINKEQFKLAMAVPTMQDVGTIDCMLALLKVVRGGGSGGQICRTDYYYIAL